MTINTQHSFMWSAIRRRGAGAILIAIQTAIAVGVLCNAIFVIQQRASFSARPSGAAEKDVFVIGYQLATKSDDVFANLREDLSVLRALPGVVDAAVSDTYPLSNNGSTGGIRLSSEQSNQSAGAAIYYGDDHLTSSLGLQLVSGRGFESREVGFRKPGEQNSPSAVIVTQALAQKLFGDKNAVGQFVYVDQRGAPVPIVGIVKLLQVPWTTPGGWGAAYDRTFILPLIYASNIGYFVVKAKPGELKDVMHRAERALLERSNSRVIRQPVSLSDARADAYRSDRGLAILLTYINFSLLAVTGGGFFALASYWVSQRRREIGIRRALGATRRTILFSFQVEGLLLALAGSGIGIVLAIALSDLLKMRFEVTTVPTGHLLLAVAIVVSIAQGAVLAPAIRGAYLPPSLVMRTN